MNVSEFTNIEDSTGALLAMTQAFDEMSFDEIIDKLNGVGDSYSSTTAQLADGMKNVAGVLKISGNTFDQSLAMLAAAEFVGGWYGNIPRSKYLIALIA